MTVDILKQKITTIEGELKKLEASFNQLAGAKMMLESLITEMSAPPVETPEPAPPSENSVA